VEIWTEEFILKTVDFHGMDVACSEVSINYLSVDGLYKSIVSDIASL
jgi:hypothetical protein